METPTAVPTYNAGGYRTTEQRSLALALMKTLPNDGKYSDLKGILADYEVELAHSVGLDSETAYEPQNLFKVLVWDRTEDRNANTLLAEVQEIPEIANSMLPMLRSATIDALAELRNNDGRGFRFSDATERLVAAYETVFPGTDIRGWVADIASDNAHEVWQGLGPSGAPLQP